MIQGSAEWLKARAGRVTGSRIGALLGCSGSYQTRAGLMREMVREMIGAPSETVVTPAMQRGLDLEQTAIDLLLESLDKQLEPRPALVVHQKNSRVAYSPDGVTTDGELIEVKCPTTAKTEISENWIAQVQLGLEVLDLEICWFGILQPDGSLYLEAIKRDRAWLAKAQVEIVRFLFELDSIVEDEFSLSQYLEPLERPVEFGDLEVRFVDLLEAKKRAESELAELREQILAVAGDAPKAIGNLIRVTQVRRDGSVDYKKALTALEKKTGQSLDLEPFKKSPTFTSQITLKTGA